MREMREVVLQGFGKNVLENPKPCVVLGWLLTGNCPICRQNKGAINDVSDRFKDAVEWLWINAEKTEGLNISRGGTILFFKGGKEVGRIEKGTSPGLLKKKVVEFFEMGEKNAD